MNTAHAIHRDHDHDRRVLGARIRHLRTEAHLEQAELADALGVSRPLISKWENGKSTPDALEVIDIARILGSTVADLLDVGTGVLKLSRKSVRPSLRAIDGGRRSPLTQRPLPHLTPVR